MKKRLSDDVWAPRIVNLTIIGIVLIVSFTLRATFLTPLYGVIDSEIPALQVAVKDPDSTAYRESPRALLGEKTPTVILTTKEFYFGTLKGFSTDFTDVRNKFHVPHNNGAPNITGLVKTMSKWFYQEDPKEESHSAKGIVILLPDKNIPTPIVIQTISMLKSTPFFDQVILAGGII